MVRRRWHAYSSCPRRRKRRRIRESASACLSHISLRVHLHLLYLLLSHTLLPLLTAITYFTSFTYCNHIRVTLLCCLLQRHMYATLVMSHVCKNVPHLCMYGTIWLMYGTMQPTLTHLCQCMQSRPGHYRSPSCSRSCLCDKRRGSCMWDKSG
jgi:hypothetical protein